MNLRRIGSAAALLATLGLAFAPLPAAAALVQIDPAYNTIKATAVDGANITEGALADAACATDNGICSINAVMKRVAQRLTTINTTLSATLTIQGGQAQGAAPAGNPLQTGLYNGTDGFIYRAKGVQNGLNDTGTGITAAGLVGQCDDTSPQAITENQFGEARVNCTNHAMIVQPYESSPNTWNYAAASAGIANTTTAVTIKTAAGSGIRNYVTSCQVQSATLGGASELAIRDGAAGTVLFRTQLQTTAMPLTTITFPVALKGTANTLLEVVTLTAVTGGVYVNCQGFVAP